MIFKRAGELAADLAAKCDAIDEEGVSMARVCRQCVAARQLIVM
jgi:hypothetical protein